MAPSAPKERMNKIKTDETEVGTQAWEALGARGTALSGLSQFIHNQ